jgi:hypothetical protein
VKGEQLMEVVVLDIFAKDPTVKHEWQFVQSSYGYAGWSECSCGYHPNDQEEMDNHSAEVGMDIPGERGEVPNVPVTYDVNPVYDGVNSSDIIRHTSMVAAIRDMVDIVKTTREADDGLVYGWHIQYNDGTNNRPYAEYLLADDEKNEKKESN